MSWRSMMDTRYRLGDGITLGDGEGLITGGARAWGGEVEFETEDGAVRGTVLKCRGPDVALEGAQVWLVEEMAGGGPAGRYALMVDDAYWGVRIEPAEFAAAPLDEVIVMGYRLRGKVLSDGEPVAGANVSLEARLATVDDGEVVLWDSEEFNELVYSESLETWVEGPEVLCPITTDAQGEWEHIVPKGDGAIYQREGDLRDDSPETAARPLARHCSRIEAVHRGRRARAEEGEVAVINLDSATLRIVGTPGAHLKVATLDHTGQTYAVPHDGEVVIEGLAACEHSIVQFKRNAWGAWDCTWGCPRAIARLESGAETTVELAAMEEYDPWSDIVAGRVYERPGVPAAGIEIVAISSETYELVGKVATTDGEGYWEAEIPEMGFGGSLWVHDAQWGSVPVLGSPYSDIVLGARAYSAWFDMFRPEAWRKGDFGHRNFAWAAGAIWVRDHETHEEFATEEGEHGGWITSESLPKHRHVGDLAELIEGGPQLREYDLVEPDGLIGSGFVLGSQPFEDWETPPGNFRASGFYPEAKLLLGGKAHGNVLLHGEGPVTEDEPEAARMGLEFGDRRPVVEVRLGPAGDACDHTSFAGLTCPYCGGPAERDPAGAVAEQGYCVQCAGAFGNPRAMDCRTFFRSPTMGARGRLWQRVVAPMREGWVVRPVRFHWRPDVYEETDAYITQSGPGQPTNAPRWFARHLHDFGDGRGCGQFDGDAAPPYLPGHDLEHFSGLPEIDRDLGSAQLKLVFDAGYVVPDDFTVEVDCVLASAEVETRRVTVRAGLRGPCAEAALGDAVRLAGAAKLTAEAAPSPYRGSGIYKGIADIRLVAPETAPGCRFTVVAEAPFLASALGVPLEPRRSTPAALQVDRVWGNPHLMCDGVGQVFLAYTHDGDIRVHRRGGLAGAWDEGIMATSDGLSDHAWLAKDPANALVLARELGGSATRLQVSRDDGRHWEG